ncbi:MAG: hypothetical protein E5X67_23125 [Mesorhizobium sp.]|uniref:hypothetical protein n=1 Tax=Mesorhizobium sp. TaxID=1871066 RepID=UPI0011F65EDC|nr:hypothetical protein [Mesorhizobium sp.]TIP25837.1 MAG: hypothetical protein E5X67_23125 [Mesorhizobium sp.]
MASSCPHKINHLLDLVKYQFEAGLYPIWRVRPSTYCFATLGMLSFDEVRVGRAAPMGWRGMLTLALVSSGAEEKSIDTFARPGDLEFSFIG